MSLVNLLLCFDNYSTLQAFDICLNKIVVRSTVTIFWLTVRLWSEAEQHKILRRTLRTKHSRCGMQKYNHMLLLTGTEYHGCSCVLFFVRVFILLEIHARLRVELIKQQVPNCGGFRTSGKELNVKGRELTLRRGFGSGPFQCRIEGSSTSSGVLSLVTILLKFLFSTLLQCDREREEVST